MLNIEHNAMVIKLLVMRRRRKEKKKPNAQAHTTIVLIFVSVAHFSSALFLSVAS